jgi:hypothetical protein
MLLNYLILSFTAITKLQNPSIWNISNIAWGKNNKNHEILNDKTLKVFYPKGSYTPSIYPQGGIGFYASPESILPANEVIFKYQVRFDETFNPMLGGKLPGLFLSKGVDKKYMKQASGGKHNNNTASIRIAWRKDFDGEAYLYVPEQQNINYYLTENYIENKVFGDSFWRGLFKFTNKTWNDISIHVKVNSFDRFGNPRNNGLLKITINNVTQQFNQLIWRVNPETQITAILFATFFGGKTDKYATPVNTWTYFRNAHIFSDKENEN